MNRAQFASDSDSNFDTAQQGQQRAHAASDPFGPVIAWDAAEQAHQASPAPVFATPSIAPPMGISSGDFDSGAYDYDDDLTVARKKPKWLIGLGALAILAAVSAAGIHRADTSRAEEQRLSQIEQVKQQMSALEAQRRNEEARKPIVEQQVPATSSVAALLAASTHSNGAAGIVTPDAEKPRGKAAARQAAAIKRALAVGNVSKRGRSARPGRHASKAKKPTEDDAEERSNDPIYGL